MTSPNNTALAPIQPTCFTFLGATTAGGFQQGGVLIGDFVNDSGTTPAGSWNNIPTVTLIGGAPVSAQLELQSTTGALLVMRMTTTQRNAILTPAVGMMIYNTTANAFQVYQGASPAWVSISAGSGGVVGPGTSVANTVATYADTSGALLADTAVVITSGAISAVTSIQNAVGSVSAPSYTFTAETDVGMWSSAAHTLDFSTNSLEALQLTAPQASAVNYLYITASATGAAPILGGTGTDTNVGIDLVCKGTGGVAHPLGAVATPSITFLGRTDVGLYTSAAHTLDVAINSTHAVTITGTALQVLTGNLIAGVSGTAGTVSSFPATGSKGSLILAAVANTGNTTTTISNAAMGQASVVSIPDPGASTANFVLAPSALVSGNLVEATGTAGLVEDSGVTVASVSGAVTQLGQLYQTSVTLNTAAVVAAYATPQVLIAAVAGKVAIVHSANVYTASTGNTPFATGTAPIIQYGTTVHGAGTIATGTGLVTGDIEAAASQVRTIGPAASTTYTGITDTAVCFSCATAYTAGTGTSVTFTLVYELITATI